MKEEISFTTSIEKAGKIIQSYFQYGYNYVHRYNQTEFVGPPFCHQGYFFPDALHYLELLEKQSACYANFER